MQGQTQAGSVDQRCRGLELHQVARTGVLVVAVIANGLLASTTFKLLRDGLLLFAGVAHERVSLVAHRAPNMIAIDAVGVPPWTFFSLNQWYGFALDSKEALALASTVNELDVPLSPASGAVSLFISSTVTTAPVSRPLTNTDQARYCEMSTQPESPVLVVVSI